jgi:putative nucleotidyltransferase with HDIG domain
MRERTEKMGVTIQGWKPETERLFKEALFRFLEEINSTKAALYLLVPDGAYLLATQYGFGRRDVLAERHEARAPLVLKAREIRDRPLVVNHRDESPELFEILHTAGSDRMLLTPLYSDSRLVGFVDARDKGRKRPFLDEDVTAAHSIADDLIKLIRTTGVVEAVERDVSPEPVVENPAQVLRPQDVPRTTGVVLDRIGLEQLYSCFVAEVSREPEVVLAALTLADGSGVGSRVIVTEGPGAVESVPLLHHQAEVLREAGLEPPAPDAWSIQTVTREDRHGGSGSLVVGSSVLIDSEGWAVVGGAVGCAESDSVPRMMYRLGLRAREISSQSVVRLSRNRLARGLLRPSGEGFPHLETHAHTVSRLAWLMALDLGLSRTETEAAAFAGLLHDIGMIELDYERIYRMKVPGPEERKIYRSHVIEGERIVTEAGLSDIKEAVRYHHERWDGRGYPDGLSGEAIPFLARMVHVAEVWDVLTSPDSYRRPVTTERAVETMRAERGRQFDPRIVDVLFRVI